ncbi:MAG TPA: COQ9 family protein [Acetobacteraceae bacterium]|nr:COQ9 family protein [Acetobacteraceae bacterium]
MQAPERSAERDAAIAALLPNVPFDGWTHRALRAALATSGQCPDDAELLFPGGASDMVEACFDWVDRQMEAAAAADPTLAGLRVSQRVRAVITLRLRQMRPHREAMRRALSLLALPHNAPRAAAITARTVDAIWRAAGDSAADFSWYTKRALLAGVWSATLLYWLCDTTEEDAATLAFLDRRLADVRRIGKARSRLERLMPWRRGEGSYAG